MQAVSDGRWLNNASLKQARSIAGMCEQESRLRHDARPSHFEAPDWGRAGEGRATKMEAAAGGLALHEALHRARNDLAAIGAMLQSQSCSVLHPEAKAALRAAHARVTALGRVNALLEGPGLAAQTRVRTDASEFMRSLVEEIRAYASSRPLEIKVIAGRPCHLPIRQVKALGLIVNEVVTNAIKHAFPGGRSGTIRVTLTGAHGNVSLRIEDDGIGLRPPASQAGTGLGMRLIGALARQIGGAVAIDRGPEGLGTVVTVTLRSLDIIALTSMPQVP